MGVCSSAMLGRDWVLCRDTSIRDEPKGKERRKGAWQWYMLCVFAGIAVTCVCVDRACCLLLYLVRFAYLLDVYAMHSNSVILGFQCCLNVQRVSSQLTCNCSTRHLFSTQSLQPTLHTYDLCAASNVPLKQRS